MNIYYVLLELEDFEHAELEITADSEERAEDEALNKYVGLVRDVIDIQLIGAA